MSLEIIKKVLDSDAGLTNEEVGQSTRREVIDNRLLLIKNNVELIESKDDEFYGELIKLLSNYIGELYDKKIEQFPGMVFDKDGNLVDQDYDELNSANIFDLTRANRSLSNNLFKYVCDILEKNKDIKLDYYTLQKLLNRNPKLFSLSVEEDYLFRTFDYERLAKILNQNQTLKKSGIGMDDVYQLLYDTCQLNNDDVFGNIITGDQFNQNHQKVDQILQSCNAKAFVEITNIIVDKYDEKFDRFSIIKNRNEKNFCERIIAELLHSSRKNCSLIHQILSDSEIEIDYNLYYSDYSGYTDLKSLIALSKQPILIKDLLSNEENVQNFYSHGDSSISLYRLYGIVGDYEKALIGFNEKYNYIYDYTEDFDDDFNRVGYTSGGFHYEDTVAGFVKDICNSFEITNVDYSKRKEVVNTIISNDEVKYINLEDTLPSIQRVFSDEDFNTLVGTLVSKRNAGNLDFITIEEFGGNGYVIRLSTDEEVQNYLSSLNKNGASKVLSLTSDRKSKKTN